MIPNWLYLSQTSGNSGTTVITVSAATNYNYFTRVAGLTVETDNTQLSENVLIFQRASGYTDGDGYENDYLTFEILSAGSICWKSNTGDVAATIYYSKNNGTWYMWLGSAESYLSVRKGDIVRFKTEINRFSNGTSYDTFSGTTAVFNLLGNIMSMGYGDNFSGKTVFDGGNDYTYEHLFEGCTGLTNADNLVLPALTLTKQCYGYLFNGCNHLQRPPKLPATTLVEYCYYHMFEGCSSLMTAPELPATTLANSCYKGMFKGCSSLISAPSLPVTALTDSCYAYMFAGCSSLTKAPKLPSTTLNGACYRGMFQDCTSLTTAPALPSTALTLACYAEMYQGCTSLVSVPSNYLPATTVIQQCYYHMFSGCTSLKQAPELLASDISPLACYSNMFRNCSSLSYVKCMSNSINTYSVDSWLLGVSKYGTFVKTAGVNWGYGGNNGGIPYYWNIIDG